MLFLNKKVQRLQDICKLQLEVFGFSVESKVLGVLATEQRGHR